MLGKQDYYRLPRGSQDIPHPRTIPDIISRSIFIHLCAALAYALLLSTLQRTSWRRGINLPGPWWIWILCSVLFPELILVQIGLWLMNKLYSCAVELLGTNLRLHNQRRRGIANGTKSPSITATLVQFFVLVIPLFFAFKGYRQRLAMRYHEANYVANLGLDHRNGWATISGLVSSAAIFGVLLISIVGGRRIHDNKTAAILSQSSRVMADGEGEDLRYHEENDGNRNDERKESNDLSRQTNDQIHASFGREPDEAPGSSLADLFNNLDAMLPLVLTALIHQVLLAVTNRFPPLIAFFTTSWCFLVVPILCISFFLLPLSQQQISRQAFTSRNWNDLPLPFTLLLQNAVIIASWLLIGSTIIVQAWCDGAELGNAGAGHMQAWNYRWRVKDQFSHGDSDRVYMG